MKKLKIGILTEIVNYHSGARAPLEIAKYLSRLGQEVCVYAYSDMKDNLALRDLQKNFVMVKFIEKPRMLFLGRILASANLFKLLTQDKPDVMTFSGTPPFFFAAKLTGIPVVRIYQGSQFDAYMERKLPNEKVNFFEKLMNLVVNLLIYLIEISSFRLANAVVAISQYCALEGKTFYKRKVDKIIYHGTSDLNSKPKNSHSKKIVNLISVSRLTPYKGFHLIVEALKILNETNTKFTIIGSQPKPKYQKYLKQIGGKNLKIIINPSDTQLAKLYSISQIYVNADRYLYFGLPICEAARFNLPTVSFNFAAAKELVLHGKTGYVAKNPEEFAFFVKKLISNPNLREKMGKNARLRSKQFFTWTKAAQEYLKLFQKLT